MSYAKQEVEENVWELALQRVRHMYDRFDQVSVSFSGGKDSTACLLVALTVARERNRLPLDVVFWDEEAIPPETVEYISRVQAMPEIRMRWFCVPVKYRNACSRMHPFWYPWDPEREEDWVRPMPTNDSVITEADMPTWQRVGLPAAVPWAFPDKSKQIGQILGLRAGESLNRHRAVSSKKADNWISSERPHGAPHVYSCKPIYDWTTDDVWTLPAMLGADYNHTYDVMARGGIAPSNQRVANPYAEEPLQHLHIYAQLWPEMWERMQRRVPGARTAARYAVSPLYGKGRNTRLKKPPPGITWQAAISQALTRWAPDQRKAMAKRIKDIIQGHNRITGNMPIPDYGPGSYISWSLLYSIAVGGDLKGRKTVMNWLPGKDDLPGHLRALYEEKQAELEAPSDDALDAAIKENM